MSIFQDWRVNEGRPNIQVLLVSFRLAQKCRSSRSAIYRIVFGVPSALIYRAVALSAFSIDIPVSTSIGPRLAVHHGMALVVHNLSVVGSDVTLRHSTTLGSNSTGSAPTIGDNVSIGANCCIIGGVRVGGGAVVGAGSVVVKDVEQRSVVAGNPARVLKSCR